MRIANNIAAINTSRNSKITSDKRAGNIKKLSSGLRINSAADDAAGVAISEKMRAQFRGLDAAVKNTQDAISFVQTADGAMDNMHNMLHRMKELSVQAANDINDSIDREAIQAEIDAVKENIKETIERMNFNGTYVFRTGTITEQPGSDKLWVQTGAYENEALPLEKPIIDIQNDLKLEPASNLDMSTHDSASQALENIKTASDVLSQTRAKMGAYNNRLEFVISKNEITAENVRNAESRIRDVDMAKETTDMVKNQIKSDAATSMMAHVNSLPQNVLQLLG